MDVSIRKARLNDLPAILNLWKEFRKYMDKMIFKRNNKLKPHFELSFNNYSDIKKHISNHIRSKNSLILVAEVESEIVGCSLVIINKNPEFLKIKQYGFVSDIYVRKDFRNKKVGTLLMKENVKWFKQKGMKYMKIGLAVDNKEAHEAYKKWDFDDYFLYMVKKIQ
jgi:GNAT superfamily N-acetyltransferase